MAQEIRVPRLGWSMEEGTFVRWLKRDGEAVKVGDAIYELEGEKAMQEIEAVDAGFLRIPPDAPQPGTVVLVGALLGFVAAVDELTPWLDAPVASAAGRASQPVSGSSSLSPPRGGGRGEGPAAAIVSASSASSRRKPSTPRARRIAAELGIDWSQLSGTGKSGRVREADVRAVNGSGSKLSARRRTIAERMLASHQRTAPVTLTTRADVTCLVQLREQFKTSGEIVPTYTDLLAFRVSRVLKDFPYIGSRWNSAGDALQAPGDDGIHLGFAVDTDDGLVVPVLRNVGSMSIPQIAEQSRDLVARARAGGLSSAELAGGVFTITNLGAFGIDAFTPIINYPETAILGVGAIRREPLFLDNGRVEARQVITLSLTFDHRAYDGAPAARFLHALVRAIENP